MALPKTFLQHNIRTLRQQPLSEISGALGDLGTFLPILISLSTHQQISLTTTLIFTGIYNILTGLFFGIPLPVQPMKAIAAVALVRGLSAGDVAAAGIFVSACVGAFALTGLLRWFNTFIPVPVVKGIQVGAGLSLCMAGGNSIKGLDGWTSPSWADNWIWAVAAFLFLLVVSAGNAADDSSRNNEIATSRKWGKVPYALIVFIVGLVFASIQIAASSHTRHPTFHLWHPYTQVPSPRNWSHGILSAGIGQLPLTTLNSVIAVVQLSSDLNLPSNLHQHHFLSTNTHSPSPVTVTSVGLSVALMNLVGCFFGAMPCCHGSGGLAAQYRFGARSGASVMLLGLFKLVLGLVFGSSLSDLLKKFPKSMLAIMVIAAGLELASVGESLNTKRAGDIGGKERTLTANGAETSVDHEPVTLNESETKKRWTIMLVTIAMLIAFKNDAIGFVAGMLCYWSYRIPDLAERISNPDSSCSVRGWLSFRRAREREGGIRLLSDED